MNDRRLPCPPEGAWLSRCSALNGAKLRRVRRCGWDLCCSDLRRADLCSAVLPGAVLVAADLRDAWLARIDLTGADLRRASLRRADLSRAVLVGADLRGADLRGACLIGSDLRGARLAGADLRGTQLGNLFQPSAKLTGATYDATTRWMWRFRPDEHGLRPVSSGLDEESG